MGRQHRRGAEHWVVVASLVVLLSACGPAESTGSVQTSPPVRATTTAPPTSTAPEIPSAQVPAAPSGLPDSPGLVAPGTALAALATVPVKGRAPKTGYDRALFGQAWADVDRNGCDTRNDILTRDLTAATYKPGTNRCLVLTGMLNDPYSGTALPFNRGPQSADIQIDHVVALSDAWQKGAQPLETVRRTALANDPLNLLAVDGRLNMQKSDSDAASWLPPNKSYRCAYVARQVAVKSAYALWVTTAEHDAIAAILQGCPDEPLPAVGQRPASVAPDSAPSPPPPPPVPALPAAPAGTPFANCAAARAAGAAPVHRGDAGYSSKLDRDGDGIGCE